MNKEDFKEYTYGQPRKDYMQGKITFDDYYLKLAQLLDITITNLQIFRLKDINDLQTKYKEDRNLNNIPLSIFDSLTFSFNMYHPQIRLTDSEGTCIYKVLLKQLALQ